MQEQDFQQIATADQAKQRQKIVDNLNHELGEQETGQQVTLRPREDSGKAVQQKKEQEEHRRAILTLTMMLANNPAYAKLHRETMNLISRAEIATEQAIADTMERLRLAEEQLALTLQSATRIPDGNGGTVAVFKDDDGRVWTEHDEEITDPAITDGIMWKDGSPSRNQYNQDRNLVTQENDTLDELRQYQVDVLGDAREQMTDETNPKSYQDVEKISNNIQTSTPDMVGQKMTVAATPELQAVNVENALVPKL